MNLVELLQFLPAQVGVAFAIMILLFWAVRSIRNLSGSDSTYKELVDTLREEIKMLREREREANSRVDRFAHERNEALGKTGAMESTIQSQEEKIEALEHTVKQQSQTIELHENTLDAQGGHIVKLEQYANTVLFTLKGSASGEKLDLPPMPIYRRPRSMYSEDNALLARPHDDCGI